MQNQLASRRAGPPALGSTVLWRALSDAGVCIGIDPLMLFVVCGPKCRLQVS